MQMSIQRLGRWSDPAQPIQRGLTRVEAICQLLIHGMTFKLT
jgi:hypothetical protein